MNSDEAPADIAAGEDAVAGGDATGGDEHAEAGGTQDRSDTEAVVKKDSGSSSRGAGEVQGLTPELIEIISFVLASGARKSKPSQRRAKLFPNAFEVDEELIRKLDNRARAELEKLKHFTEGQDVTFSALVRFEDFATQEYDNLTQLFDAAGEKRDPESVLLSWELDLFRPAKGVAKIEVAYVTEAAMTTEEFSLFSPGHNRAKMEVEVGGPTSDWTEATYSNVYPIVEVAKLGGIYAPLLWFRRDGVVWASSFVLAILSQTGVAALIARLRSAQRNVDRVSDVLSRQTLEQKFTRFVEIIFSTDTGFGSFLLGILPVLVFLGFLALGYFVFPKLVPRSTIALGLASRRIARYRNVFNFIVFNLILLGVLIPIIINLIT